MVEFLVFNSVYWKIGGPSNGVNRVVCNFFVMCSVQFCTTHYIGIILRVSTHANIGRTGAATTEKEPVDIRTVREILSLLQIRNKLEP